MTLPHRNPRRSAGFTLLEMMVAMTVSLFIIGALATVVIGGSATNRSRDRASDLQVNGRYAIDQIRRDLQHAGFLGLTSLFLPDVPVTTLDIMPGATAVSVANVCDPAAIGKLSDRIFGSDNANPFSATCLPAANYLQGDVLVIRGLNPSVDAGPYSATRVYYRSAYEGGSPFVGPTLPNFTGSNRQAPYLAYQMEETVYYISPYTTSATESPLVPALYRLRLSTGPAMVAELVASGVENMQVRYGIFQTDNTIRYLKASEITVASDWDMVRSVQVSLLMRASTTEPGYTNNSSYNLSGTTVTVNDGYPRLMLGALVQQRN
jgi:type IV pilus assembly protein PilW